MENGGFDGDSRLQHSRMSANSSRRAADCSYFAGIPTQCRKKVFADEGRRENE